MRLLFFLIITITPIVGLFAQTNVKYLSKDNEYADSLNAYYQLSYEYLPQSGGYIKTKKKMDGTMVYTYQLSSKRPEIKEGKCKVYYEDTGIANYEGNYSNNKMSGDWNYYYNNGSFKELVNYDIPDSLDVNCKILTAKDSIGNDLVINGNGIYKEDLTNSFSKQRTFLEQKIKGYNTGKIVDGLKDSIWTGFLFDSKDTFVEKWKLGKFISGIRKDTLQKTYEYNHIDIQPEPHGGIQNFYRFIGENIKYPKKSQKVGVQGKVYVQFIVDVNGDVFDTIILRGLNSEMDNEVLRVMAKSPKWKNGFYRGKPAKIKMILPVVFKLN